MQRQALRHQRHRLDRPHRFAGHQSQRIHGAHRLSGRVARLSRASGSAEVALELDAGLNLVGFSDAASGLKTGSAAVPEVDKPPLLFRFLVKDVCRIHKMVAIEYIASHPCWISENG